MRPDEGWMVAVVLWLSLVVLFLAGLHFSVHYRLSDMRRSIRSRLPLRGPSRGYALKYSLNCVYRRSDERRGGLSAFRCPDDGDEEVGFAAAMRQRPMVIYCLDLERRLVVFIEIEEGRDLLSEPSLARGALALAGSCVVVASFDTVCDYLDAREVVDEGLFAAKRSLWVWNGGGCGSTLVHRLLVAARVISLSEPYWLEQLCRVRGKGQLSDDHMCRVLRMCCAMDGALVTQHWLKSHAKGDVIAVHAKGMSLGHHMLDLVKREFPDARHLFLYSDAIPAVESMSSQLYHVNTPWWARPLLLTRPWWILKPPIITSGRLRDWIERGVLSGVPQPTVKRTRGGSTRRTTRTPQPTSPATRSAAAAAAAAADTGNNGSNSTRQQLSFPSSLAYACTTRCSWLFSRDRGHRPSLQLPSLRVTQTTPPPTSSPSSSPPAPAPAAAVPKMDLCRMLVVMWVDAMATWCDVTDGRDLTDAHTLHMEHLVDSTLRQRVIAQVAGGLAGVANVKDPSVWHACTQAFARHTHTGIHTDDPSTMTSHTGRPFLSARDRDAIQRMLESVPDVRIRECRLGGGLVGGCGRAGCGGDGGGERGGTQATMQQQERQQQPCGHQQTAREEDPSVHTCHAAHHHRHLHHHDSHRNLERAVTIDTDEDNHYNDTKQDVSREASWGSTLTTSQANAASDQDT